MATNQIGWLCQPQRWFTLPPNSCKAFFVIKVHALPHAATGIIKSNINKIKSNFSRICISGKTNTLKKIMIAEESGFDGVEIDLLYDDSLDTLIVADQQKNSGLSLSVYLNQMKNWKYKRLVLRINNITTETQYKILNILNSLNELYDIIDCTLLVFPENKCQFSLGDWRKMCYINNSYLHEILNSYYNSNFYKLDLKNNNMLIYDDKFVLVLDNMSVENILKDINGKNFFDFTIYNVVTDGEL